jgi:hypothetical protein
MLWRLRLFFDQITLAFPRMPIDQIFNPLSPEISHESIGSHQVHFMAMIVVHDGEGAILLNTFTAIDSRRARNVYIGRFDRTTSNETIECLSTETSSDFIDVFDFI